MLPYNQRQITEQAKFVYSPVGKALEKQTIGGCGEKQIEDSKKQLDNKQTGNNEFLLLIEREIFKNIYNRLNKIDELSKKMGYDDLKLIFNSSGVETNVSQLEDSAAYFIVLQNMKYR